MIKIFISNIQHFKTLKRNKYLRKFFLFDLRRIESLHDPVLHSLATTYQIIPEAPSKETSYGRLSDIDTVLLSLLSKNREYVVHDVAVSNGITSLALFNTLQGGGINFKMFISDKVSELYFLKWGCLGVTLTKDNNFLYGDCLGIACIPDAPYKLFLSKLAGILCRYLWNRKRNGIRNASIKKINLLFKDVLDLIKKGKINYITYDVFNKKFVNTFDVIRCVNLLNLSYFSPPKIVEAIDGLKISLKEDGILEIGSSSGQSAKITLYKRKNDSLEVIQKINGGYALDYLIRSYDKRCKK